MSRRRRRRIEPGGLLRYSLLMTKIENGAWLRPGVKVEKPLQLKWTLSAYTILHISWNGHGSWFLLWM